MQKRHCVTSSRCRLLVGRSGSGGQLMVLVGQRFETEAEVDQTLQAIGDQLKEQIRAGFTVVVR